MIFDRSETMSTDERAALQTERLRDMIDRLLAADGLQASRLAEAGVKSGADVSLDHLSRLPTTQKPDLWENYPFGMVAVPSEDVVCVHGSSGTGGRPTLVAYTEADVKLWGHVMARCLAGAGATRESLIHNAYGYGLFTGGLGIHHGAGALGAAVVPISGGMTARQQRLIQDLRPDVLTCTPSYAVYLGEAFAGDGVDPGELSLKVGIHGAEPWTDAMRDKIESLLGIKALDIYGLSEIIGPGVACETLASAGWLHVQEDHFLVEILDPATGESAADGELGELAFTTVTKQALPLLRYRTGDIATLDRTPSPDGRTTVKMSKIVGRRDDMLVVRGVNVYPSEVEAVVLADPATAPHYLLVVDARSTQTQLVVCCEADREAADATAARLGAGLKERLGLTCEVRVLAPGEIPRTEVGKARRVTRWEPDAEPPLPGL
ncbi:MAG: AMP-binding protein [Micromonosporaceae bacterium]|nr:AMP-binding protein [Micromonosporaceae bacterium]